MLRTTLPFQSMITHDFSMAASFYIQVLCVQRSSMLLCLSILIMAFGIVKRNQADIDFYQHEVD